jgi:hypothetical protein
MNNIMKYHKNEQEITIDLIKSAPNQVKPFPHIKDLCEHWRLKGYKEVVDVGCGQLRNSLTLVNYFKLWVCDFPQQFNGSTVKDRLKHIQRNRNFMGIINPNEFQEGKLVAEAAVIAYVLNILPEIGMRIKLIKNTIRNTKAPHEIFIGVPNGEHYYRQRIGMHNQLNDGHLFEHGGRHKTFYREYTAKQIDEFMARLGFKLDKTFPAHKKNQRTYLKEK